MALDSQTINQWEKIKNQVRDKYPQPYSQLFNKNAELKSFSNGLGVIVVNDLTSKTRINSLYIKDMEEEATKNYGSKVRFKILTVEEWNSQEEKEKEVQKTFNVLNRNYTFDNFIVGDSNRLAYKTAQMVANQPGELYRTLYIFGDVGLGKTHLMQAIGNAYLDNNVDKVVLYVKADMFLEEYGHASEQLRTRKNENAINEFKDKYRSCDVLLIDDIQMLGLGIQTQTILFQLFDFLTSNNKQIVITSDKPASSLVLMDRLKSRFEGSLNVDIKSPDYQQRMEILKYKVKTNDSIEVPDNVIEFIAQNFNKNVRELEGALKKVQADSYILGLTPNLDTAKESLVSLLVNKEIVESIDITKLKRIQTEVANTFSITVDELIGKKRNESYTLPRHIAIYLMREKYNLTYKDIARLFGGRDHSTIISSIKNIERLILTDQKVKETIDIINRKLQE